MINSILNKEESLILELRSIFEAYGYKKYRMNRFEEYSLYMNNKDFLVSESVISFTNLDGKLLALKPDVTLSIVKYAAMDREQRLYYIENVYRPDKAKRNYCEIEQMGLERIGVIDDYAIAETLYLAGRSLNTVSKDSLLEISHMGYVFGLFNYYNISSEYIPELLKLIAGKNSAGIRKYVLSIGIEEQGAEAISQIPFLFGDWNTVIDKAKALCSTDECAAALKQLVTLGKLLSDNKGICPVRLDLSVVGDSDYYNGIIFNGYINGLPAKVLSGGQYDRILKKLRKSGGAIGFAIYLNELSYILASKYDYDCDIIIKYDSEDDISDLNKFINTLIKEGKTVYACLKGLKTDIRAKEEIIFNGELVEEM